MSIIILLCVSTYVQVHVCDSRHRTSFVDKMARGTWEACRISTLYYNILWLCLSPAPIKLEVLSELVECGACESDQLVELVVCAELAELAMLAQTVNHV